MIYDFLFRKKNDKKNNKKEKKNISLNNHEYYRLILNYKYHLQSYHIPSLLCIFEEKYHL